MAFSMTSLSKINPHNVVRVSVKIALCLVTIDAENGQKDKLVTQVISCPFLRYLSIALAALRPSLIAQTTKD